MYAIRSYYVSELLENAVEAGALIRNPGGGERLHTLMRPALLTGVTGDMRIFEEEQFGPILPVLTFADEAEAS